MQVAAVQAAIDVRQLVVDVADLEVAPQSRGFRRAISLT